MLRALALVTLLLTGCASLSEPAASPPALAMDGARARVASEASAPAERLLIRRGHQSVEVDELASAVTLLERLVAERGGRIESSRIEERTATQRVRVPTAELDGLLEAVAALGEEKSRQVTAEDVTEAVADLDAELANQVALRDRLRELAARAQKVEEVLQVERELARVQARVDSITGRLERLRKDVAMSTLEVHLTEREHERVIWGPVQVVVRGAAWLLEKLWVIEY